MNSVRVLCRPKLHLLTTNKSQLTCRGVCIASLRHIKKHQSLRKYAIIQIRRTLVRTSCVQSTMVFLLTTKPTYWTYSTPKSQWKLQSPSKPRCLLKMRSTEQTLSQTTADEDMQDKSNAS